MHTHKGRDRDSARADDEHTERVMQQWFAGRHASAESDAALVVVEANALKQETLEYAGLVRAEAEALAAATLATAPTPEASLDDLLIATEVVVDMCEALLRDTNLNAAQRSGVETVHETVKPVPDLIRQAIAEGQTASASGTAHGPGAGPTGGALP